MKNINIQILKKGIKIAIILITSFTQIVIAQNPLPGKKQERPIVIQNAIIHNGNGVVFANGEIAFDKGIITYVGPITKNIPTNAQVIDAKGAEIYPGLISMGSQVGLSDIESIPATNDFQEMGSINPNIRTLVAYNTDSDVIPTVRGNGILISQAMPEGGLIAGQSSAITLDGWNWQDAVAKADDGIWVNWPALMNRTFSFETFSFNMVKNEKRKDLIQDLDKILKDTKAYLLSNKNPKNLKLEALTGLFDGSKVWYINTESAKEIIESVQFAKAMGIEKIAVYGASEAEDCIEFLKENNIPVILNSTHEVPARNDNAVYSNYNLPGILQKSGIQTVISYGGKGWRTRNLPFLAGSAVAFGLDKEEALKMVTQNPAKIMGIDKEYGTLEKGKSATIVMSKGDIFDMRTNQVLKAFIDGKEVNLDDKQKQLHRKFSENVK